jgi:hypothetical protein
MKDQARSHKQSITRLTCGRLAVRIRYRSERIAPIAGLGIDDWSWPQMAEGGRATSRVVLFF